MDLQRIQTGAAKEEDVGSQDRLCSQYMEMRPRAWRFWTEKMEA